MGDAVRFWNKVNFDGPDDCWEWTAVINVKGYGIFRYRGSPKMAHRYAWELAHGPPSASEVVHHLCGNKRCVRVTHLQAMSKTQHDAMSEIEHNTPRYRLKG